MAVFKYPKGRRYRKANPRKRPPLEWDGLKPLKFKVWVFCNKERVEAQAYSIIESWYSPNGHAKIYGSILVQRLD